MLNEIRPLENRLNQFKRLHYRNIVLQGMLQWLVFTITSIACLSLLNFIVGFSIEVKTFLFYGMMLFYTALLSWWVLIPLLKLLGFVKGMNNLQVGKLLGRNINGLEDRVVNALELSSIEQNDFVSASIEQKVKETEKFDFLKAINYKDIVKMLWVVAGVLLFSFLLGTVNHDIYLRGGKGLLNYNLVEAKEVPFHLNVLNEEFKVLEGEDFNLEVLVEGNVLPNEVRLSQSGLSYRMFKSKESIWSYQFNSVKESFDFFIESEGIKSKSYRLTVVKKPTSKFIHLNVIPPSYTNRKTRRKLNPLRNVIAEGSKVEVVYETTDGTVGKLLHKEEKAWKELKDKFMLRDPKEFKLLLSSNEIVDSGKVSYFIDVLKDDFPSINVEFTQDEVVFGRYYFVGNVQDDYGISRIEALIDDSIQPISFDEGETSGKFYFEFDTENNSKIEFRVWDNDGVNGSKFSLSKKIELEKQDQASKNKKLSKAASKGENGLSDFKEKQKEWRESLERSTESLKKKGKLDWKLKKELGEDLERGKQLQKEFSKLKEELDKYFEKVKRNDAVDSNLLQKQEELQRLMDEVLDEETNKMLEELQKLLSQERNEELLKQLEKMNENSESLEENLDRNLDLFKQLKLENELNQTIERLDELQKKQQELANSKEDTAEDQEKLNEEIEEAIEEFEKQKEEWNEANDEKLNDQKENSEGAKENSKQAKESLSKGKKSKANEQQSKAAENLKKMKEQLSNDLDSAQEEQEGEDLESLRQLMENLVEFSFNQEELLMNSNSISDQDPLWKDLNRKQLKLKDDFSMIADSLDALASRVTALSSYVLEEKKEIERELKGIKRHFGDRTKRNLTKGQQEVMLHSNNLALLLDQAQQQMMSQMSSKSKSGKCKKPGKGEGKGKPKPNMKGLKSRMKSQMEKMKKGREKGGKKPGGKSGSSFEIIQMANEQQFLRDALRQMRKEVEGKGDLGNASKLKRIEEMLEKQREDMINSNVSRETIRRQEEIMVKMLEVEDSLREQGEEEKRESNHSDNDYDQDIDAIKEYLENKLKEIELYKRSNLDYNEFYLKKKAG